MNRTLPILALLALSGCGIPAEQIACEQLARAKIAYVTCLDEHRNPADCKQPFHDLLAAMDESQTVAWYWPGEHNPFVAHQAVPGDGGGR